MGWISTLVVFNDTLHVIGRDLEFGKKVEEAVLRLSIRKPVWIDGLGAAIETHHNDGYVPVLVGHGGAKPLDFAIACSSQDPEMDLLKRLAEKRGYRLSRKPVK